MNLESYYWYFKSIIPHRICDEIIRYGLEQQEQTALTSAQSEKDNLCDDDLKKLHKKRKSNVVWMNDRWIYKEIQPYINIANQSAGWNFEWNWSESCQFTKYKLNQFYDWHCDSYSKPYDNPSNKNFYGKIRKLSVTCQLTDGAEYEGGELEFDFRNYDPSKRDESKHLVKAKEILPKGSIVVFPSHVWHRVKPVQKGTRYSLVLWNLGYSFK